MKVRDGSLRWVFLLILYDSGVPMDLQEQILPCLGNNVLLKVEATRAHAQPAETGVIFPFFAEEEIAKGRLWCARVAIQLPVNKKQT